MTTTEARRKHARVSLVAWFVQIPIGAALSAAAVLLAGPWSDVLLVYVTLLSVWTGIESGFARLNADLPIDDQQEGGT